MARLSAGVLIPGVSLERSTDEPISAQLFTRLRELVISGQLEPGARLPSTRGLANDLSVSRTTVAMAYDQLKSEGYLVGLEKSGTFVAKVLPDTLAWKVNPVPVRDIPSRANQEMFANRIDGAELAEPDAVSLSLPFNPGIPAINAFPVKSFSRLQRQVSHSLVRAEEARCPAEGASQLREQVAAYLSSSRGVICDPSQVFIISGTRQALHLLLLALSNPGDFGWTEDPGYTGAPRAYELFRVNTVPVPVDEDGMVVSEGRALRNNARFAYVTPARQAPLGHTMSLSRRLELLSWAHDVDALILEDDYDGEYRFGGSPAPSLQSLDPDGRVLYFGTFSKTLLPSLGIGYLVVPKRFIDVITRLIDTICRPPNLSTQVTIAKFIETGAFHSHIRRMRSLYLRRQNALSHIMRRELAGDFDITVLNAGLHLIGRLADDVDDKAVHARALENGLQPRPMSDFTIRFPQGPALMLGFANMTGDSMPLAIDRLRKSVHG